MSKLKIFADSVKAFSMFSVGFDGYTVLLKQLAYGRPFKLMPFAVNEIHLFSDLATDRGRKGHVEILGGEIVDDMPVGGVVDIQGIYVMTQTSSYLRLCVNAAGMDDHRVEVFIPDIDGRFVCGVDKQQINVRRNAFCPKDFFANSKLVFTHWVIWAMDAP